MEERLGVWQDLDVNGMRTLKLVGGGSVSRTFINSLSTGSVLRK